MPADYNRSILQEFADRLYSQAWVTIIAYTFFGVIIGLPLGLAVGTSLRSTIDDYTILGAVLCGVMGFGIGWRKAFLIKVQAQQMLCQMMIEQHLSQLVEAEKFKDDLRLSAKAGS